MFPQNNRLRSLWHRHRARIVVFCLLTYFICFTSYDIYFTTQQQGAQGLSGVELSAEVAEHLENVNPLSAKQRKHKYETDPDLLLDDIEERRRDTEEQLSLERQKHKTKP